MILSNRFLYTGRSQKQRANDKVNGETVERARARMFVVLTGACAAQSACERETAILSDQFYVNITFVLTSLFSCSLSSNVITEY